MKTILINPETLIQLKAGLVNGVSPEMADYIEEKNILSIEIIEESKCIILTDSVSDCMVCDFNQIIFDCSIL